MMTKAEDLIQKSRNQFTTILSISFLFSIGMVAFRLIYTSQITYLFLVWNLFLAWIPLGISWILKTHGLKIKSRLILVMLVGVWLVFFPNAPYIMTDLFHLQPRTSIPLWYDLILIMSFAWNGLIIGLVSMLRVQSFIAIRLNKSLSWIFTILSILLCSYGIYLGRFERWNSWDILTNPISLIKNMAHHLLNPSTNIQMYAIIAVFSSFIFIVYLTIRSLIKQR